MPSLRAIDLVLILVLITIISYTYIIKNNARRLNKEEAYLLKQIAAEETAIEQLKIEWASVSSPFYINKLMQHYKDLNLSPTPPKNIISIDKLPPRPKS